MTKTAMIRARTTPRRKGRYRKDIPEVRDKHIRGYQSVLSPGQDAQGLAVRCKDSQQSHSEGNEGCG